MKPAILVLFAAAGLSATEISTGAMLGRRFDQRAFYIRTSPNGPWQKTYSGSECRREAQGRLMNLRLCQALFHDEWMTEQPFDPEANTDAVIAALDFYKSHGVLMVNVSLQGGNAGYEVRQNGYRFGREKGMHVSAFLPDGGLKPAWMARLEKLVRAADRRHMIVNVMYFYQGQDELFESTRSIHAAARNATDWLIAKQFRNVVVDVANEYDLAGDRWDFAGYIPQNIIQLIDEVRDRFRTAGYTLPISASSDGRMRYPQSLMGQADVVLIHGNNRSPELKAKRTAELKDVQRPVLMNEDDNGRASTVENLAKELASCDILFKNAGGWGYMPWVQAQRFPFRYLPGPEAAVRDAMAEKERDMAYFHAVLDHIAALTLKRPPEH